MSFQPLGEFPRKPRKEKPARTNRPLITISVDRTTLALIDSMALPVRKGEISGRAAVARAALYKGLGIPLPAKPLVLPPNLTEIQDALLTEQNPALRRLLELRTRGLGYLRIAKQLNIEGHRTPHGAKWVRELTRFHILQALRRRLVMRAIERREAELAGTAK